MKYDDLTRVVEQNPGEWAKQIKMCGTCGRLYGFAANGATCFHSSCDGKLSPMQSYVDLDVIEAP